MTTLTNIKRFLNKENYDFERSDINFTNFHPHVRFFYAVNGIFFKNPKSLIRLVFPVLSTAYAFCTMGMLLMFVYHGVDVKDYSFATESFCYFVIVATVPVIYTSTSRSSDKLKQILEWFDEDFRSICKLGHNYRDTFIKGQALIWKLCCMWFSFLTFVVLTFTMSMVCALIYQSLFATQDENMIRPLVFPMWLPYDDPYRTPNYEVFLVLEIGCIFTVYLPFGVYVYLLFHFLLHTTLLMDMIIMAFGVIFNGLDESVTLLPKHDPRLACTQQILNERMRQIVTWHTSVVKYVKMVAEIFGFPLIYVILFSSLAICLMMYQIAEQLDHGKLDYLFVILSSGALVQLWIPCYLGTMIRNKAFSLGDACFNSGWHETPLGKLLRQDIILFILRAQQPVTIKYTSVPDLQLETFSSILSTAYSYFNMLRQTTN